MYETHYVVLFRHRIWWGSLKTLRRVLKKPVKADGIHNLKKMWSKCTFGIKRYWEWSFIDDRKYFYITIIFDLLYNTWNETVLKLLISKFFSLSTHVKFQLDLVSERIKLNKTEKGDRWRRICLSNIKK